MTVPLVVLVRLPEHNAKLPVWCVHTDDVKEHGEYDDFYAAKDIGCDHRVSFSYLDRCEDSTYQS